MKRIILTITLLLMSSGAWGATYYVSPTGSSTNPYDTWAKAANLPSTITNSNPSGSSNTVYIGPGSYSDNIYIQSSFSNWANGAIYGVSAAGVTANCLGEACLSYPADSLAKEVFIQSNSATNYTLDIRTGPYTIKNLAIQSINAATGNLYFAIGNTNLFILDNIYSFDPAYSRNVNAVTGRFSITRSKFSYNNSTGYNLYFSGSIPGTIANSIINTGNTQSCTGGSASALCWNSSGIGNFYNNTINGGCNRTILHLDGTLNLKNNIILSTQNFNQYTIYRDTGVQLNLYNNIIQSNWGNSAKAVYGTKNTDSNNVYGGSPKYTTYGKKGYIGIEVDDTGNYAYVEQLETLLAARNLTGTFAVIAGPGYLTAPAITSIQGMVNRGVIDIGGHTYSHSHLNATGGIYSITCDSHTINIDRANDQIVIAGTPTYTLSGFKSKLLGIHSTTDNTSIAYWLENTAGCAVGTINSNLDASGKTLGEIISSSSGAQASPYTPQILIDGTGATGFFKTELVDSKSLLESTFGITVKSMASPYSYNSTTIQTINKNAGYWSYVASYSQTGANWYLNNLNTMAMIQLFSGGSGAPVDADDTNTINNTKALCEMLSENGGVMNITSDGEITMHQWELILDTIAGYPNITVGSMAYIANIIKNSGEWSTADNQTYTRTWTDQSDYHLLPTSPAINAGTNLCATLVDSTDYDGNPVCSGGVFIGKGSAPDIGAYEYQPISRKGGFNFNRVGTFSFGPIAGGVGNSFIESGYTVGGSYYLTSAGEYYIPAN